ncbi:hypothetical protein [Tenacibaculum finnmarkense]|uniref:hypothetical protein n=1 Tax=Tenacibaculum finnmarkense TaxID=2781243 RepID=UPI001E5298D1|nr:hypothetical protein [Tenacibaculum finnmarkense]MCD8412513.1 hypothetical protein [Tenacibaculum finnmarkense genomovar ulcerans]
MPRKNKKNDRPVEFRDPKVQINEQNLGYKKFLTLIIFITFLFGLLFCFIETHREEIFKIITHTLKFRTHNLEVFK